MKPKMLRAHFGQYFNSTTYSDVTIKYGNHEIPAHKLILAQGSCYFKRCFDSAFIETKTSTVHLKDDPDPCALLTVIGTLYGHPPYDSTKTVTALEALHIVNIYVTASKYLVTDTCSQIISDFQAMLDQLRTKMEPHLFLYDVIRCVYITNEGAARSLRTPAVAHILGHITEYKELNDSRELLAEVP